MKIILVTSIVGMLAAGIYGATDMVTDVCSGTMIRYEDGTKKPAPEKQKLASASKTKKSKLPEKSVMLKQAKSDSIAGHAKIDLPEPMEWISSKSFSRSNPMAYEDLDIFTPVIVEVDSIAVPEEKPYLPEEIDVTNDSAETDK